MHDVLLFCPKEDFLQTTEIDSIVQVITTVDNIFKRAFEWWKHLDIAFSNKQFSLLGCFDFIGGGEWDGKGPHIGKEFFPHSLSLEILRCLSGWNSGSEESSMNLPTEAWRWRVKGNPGNEGRHFPRAPPLRQVKGSSESSPALKCQVRKCAFFSLDVLDGSYLWLGSLWARPSLKSARPHVKTLTVVAAVFKGSWGVARGVRWAQ